MKFILLIITVIIVTGCSTPMDKAKQDVACKEHADVYKYFGDDMYGYTLCKDGTMIYHKDWINITGQEVVKNLEKYK